MSKLVMLKGLPGSGKSTLAERLVKQESYMRVNRDLIREMLHYSIFNSFNESVTVVIEKMIVTQLLGYGENVVVDDCNLNPKNEEMWHKIAGESRADFEVEIIGTNLEECILRDSKREKSVGRAVIEEMARKYGHS